MDFLSNYTKIHAHAFSKTNNILSGFAAAGLILFKPERVLAKLHIKMKTPTPLSSLSSNQSFYLGRTQSVSSVAAEQMLEKVIKGAEMAMQYFIMSLYPRWREFNW
ncbi:uncharacterized protein ASPGLDRAFT_41489 [Aspergillus glaucus CBS 516.65]|uniref:Uncharacterized protein n=1 Tax=Aspergillus glaucus CBS 516.65 TaxID=1160497 RepID=A0A1L9VZY7_ASPGL|nr:hypothetical protein ASPGLDRAFT_41489 [Aspergillus glaucus CBS 516.65]OJJ89484.1 hypothetical protein ASPGLDRAFT_41489 [Aspergillus glaucus CBS 516.65]